MVFTLGYFRHGCGFHERKVSAHIAVDIHWMILFLYFFHIAEILVLSKPKFQDIAFMHAASLLFRCMSSSSRWRETISSKLLMKQFLGVNEYFHVD